MELNGKTYLDRFGNEWVIKVESKRGQPTRVSFTCDELRLVAAEDEPTDAQDLNSEQLKDLFCSAERMVIHRDEKWFVGFRTRIGRGGRAHGGVQTRFRSESGEVRFTKNMLQFRHMSGAALCEQLAAATRTRKATS